MAVTNRGSILISTANDIGSSLVDVIGGEGYTPNEWSKKINLCGIAAADVPTALENIEESTPSGTDRGSISLDTANAVGAVLNKKYNTARGFKPSEWASAISFLEPLPEHTASGGIANIQDGADKVPVKSWLVTLPASLDGYTKVNAKQAKKNLIPNEKYQGASTRVNIGQIDDNYSLHLKAGTYTLSAISLVQMRAYYRTSTGGSNVLIWSTYNTSGSGTFTLSEESDVRIWLYNGDGLSASDVQTFQLEVGNAATTFEPYTAPEVSEVDLGRTIYGGTADIVNGQGTDGYAKGSMTSTYLSGLSSSYIGYEASLAYFGGHAGVWVRNWNYQTAAERTAGGIGAVCNHFPISFNNSDIFASQYRVYFDVDGKNISSVQDFIDYISTLEQNNDSLDIVYELATATDFAFTPIDPIPETENGVINFWSEEGDSSVVYRADIDSPDPSNLLGLSNSNNNIEEEGNI